MVYRIYVEKKPGLANEARGLIHDVREVLGIERLEKIRVINRYDAENISGDLFGYVVRTVFSEPQLDIVSKNIDCGNARVFAVEYLPGQYDQRADSAAQCIQIISKGERPAIRTAKVYLLYGQLTENDLNDIKKYVINPVESRECGLEMPETLEVNYKTDSKVKIINGFCGMDKNQLENLIEEYGLAMDFDDILFCQDYFNAEKRDPTLTEIRVIDTYWSDHCRHTTFLTTIDSVKFEDTLLQKAYDRYIATRKAIGRTKPQNLMDIATIAVKYLRKNGQLDKLDESEEINACTVRIDVECDGVKEPWLLLFKNETHNHPTEIEPFGGAATCIGGAIRDPLSGRSYVYGAMRLTGAADPTKPVSETLVGKLPQRKIVTTAAAGYSSYGNQIGLATGIVDEVYHDGYAAKHMEIGAVIAATPAENVRRERPEPGDAVILLGGRTGRDGCGGATGSSKSHTVESLEHCGAEVQKGNAPEERKLQRLFRNAEACKMIKRCNDFGAGGVSVAIGELADGLDIRLEAVPKKYAGLDCTELAISESQERMAVVVAEKDAARFLEIAESENLEATIVASVTEEPRLVMRWNNKTAVDISREFLDSNGAEKHIGIVARAPSDYKKAVPADFGTGYRELLGDLNICSKQGLSERFDSTIGAGTVMMPFGGRYQRTPVQAMVQKISVEKKHTDDVSLMAWGYNPSVAEKSPYHGAYLAVVESVSKLIASGAKFEDVYLTFQEYFARPGRDPKRWGDPLSALLGAFSAQMDLGIGAIGGKDSMSGTFESLDVPPTLVSFAVTTSKTADIVSPEFKKAGHRVVLIKPAYNADGLPDTASLLGVWEKVHALTADGSACAVWTPGAGGIAEGIFKMCIGNGFGFSYDGKLSENDIFSYCYGSFLVELTGDCDCGTTIGYITDDKYIAYKNEELAVCDLDSVYKRKLESVYPMKVKSAGGSVRTFDYPCVKPRISRHVCERPKTVIPVFPGTNCEYDSAKVMRDAGAEVELIVLNNLTASGISRSIERFAKAVREAQIIFLPGGFSGGDEPDGSGKFITAFFRNEEIRQAVSDFLDNRDGLMCGICNGFQALIKLGLVPYGHIIDTDENCPTLTYNTIARHQSKLVRTRIVSNKSPWLSYTKPGEIYTVPISHGEGRFIADDSLIKKLEASGQIATQYVDADGNATMDIDYNPNGSVYAIEGITSPDGRVFGKMGHSERRADGLYRNVPGVYDMKMFESAVRYFKGN